MEVEVGPVAHGGHCVARVDGRAVFVRHALPGERVRVVVTEDRGSYLRADAVEVLRASPDRVVPPCPYAGPGRCGGCDWQHASPAAQRLLKAEVVREHLGVDVEVEEVPGGPLGWRTRVQYAVTPDGRLGLRRHRSRDVEPVDECRIAAPGARLPVDGWTGAESVEAVAGSSGDRAVVVTGPRIGRYPVPEGASLLHGDRPVSGRPGVREVVGERTFWVGGSGFWQVHPSAPQVLTSAVLSYAEPRPDDLALDLYGGVGLFAAALAPLVKEVVHVESWAPACDDARQNLRDLPQVRVVAGRVAPALRRLGLGRAEVVVLDPPRDGAGADVMSLVAGLAPRRVVYVACDPAALARDVGYAAAHGYRLAAVRAFDLFPMTHHVECVALLRGIVD